MRDLCLREGRHVALNATVLRLPAHAFGLWQGTTLLIVARQTSLAEVSHPFPLVGKSVRIVARDAAKASTALLKALARAHLFDVSAKLFPSLVGTIEDREKLGQRQPRSKIKRFPSCTFDAMVAQ
jgi:hypothetical protein